LIDGSFFQINSQTAEAFAADESRRELLRATKTLTFTAGTTALPSDALKKFIFDATFVETSNPSRRYAFRQWPAYLRSADKRLGYWSTIGETVGAKVPTSAAPLSGSVSLTCACSPAVPVTETDPYIAPDDFIPELIDTGIDFIRGALLAKAAETA
jgi:hypothetical protein